MNNDPHKSTTFCGCDEGANHLCERHLKEQMDLNNSPAWSPLTTIKDSGDRVTYSSGSMRDPSTGKIKWSRITFGPMMRRWAQHLTTAEAKYPDPKPGLPNFMLIETEEERIRYKESAFRHFMSWFNEETDEDHASAVFFNINGVAIIDEKRKAGPIKSFDALPRRAADSETSCAMGGSTWCCERQAGHTGNHMAWTDYNNRKLYDRGEWS